MKTGGRSIINSFLASFMGYDDVINEGEKLDKIWSMYIKSGGNVIDFEELKFYGHYVPLSKRFEPLN
jgi:hypothetical protein